MHIYGLQKLTLLDYPGKMAATVFTGRCNMRCPFCHNPDLVLNNAEEYSLDKFFKFLSTRKSTLEGICITGGEPMVNEKLGDFISEIKAMGYLVKLDTNGTFPDRLEKIIDQIDYIAIDIKNSPEKYAKTAGLENFDISCIKKSIAMVMSRAKDYEFRTTVVKGLHEIEDIEECAKLIEGAKRYYLQKFIDSGHLLGQEKYAAWDDNTMRAMQKVALKHVQSCELRGV